MRRVKWGLVAAWFGAHAWLWTLLPPAPRWSLSGVELNASGLTADGRFLVTSDRTTVNVWDITNGRQVGSWPRPSGPKRGVAALVVAPVGRRAVVFDTENGVPGLIDLDTGKSATLPPLSAPAKVVNESVIRASLSFSPDGRRYVQLTRNRDSNLPLLCIKDLTTGEERFAAVEEEPAMVLCAADGRTALVTLREPASGNWKIRLIDLVEAKDIGSLDIGAVLAVQCMGVFTHGQVAAVNIARLTGGDITIELQLWDLPSRRRLAAIAGMHTAGWNADGHLVAGDYADPERTGSNGLHLLDKTGNEVGRWRPAPQGPSLGWLSVGGRYLIDWEVRPLPAWRIWLHQRLYSRAPDWDGCTIHIYDAQSGKRRASVESQSPLQNVHLTPDGQTLTESAFDTIHAWDILPRKPGGIVLGLMIAEIALAIAWAAWRRRSFRKNPSAVSR